MVSIKKTVHMESLHAPGLSAEFPVNLSVSVYEAFPCVPGVPCGISKLFSILDFRIIKKSRFLHCFFLQPLGAFFFFSFNFLNYYFILFYFCVCVNSQRFLPGFLDVHGWRFPTFPAAAFQKKGENSGELDGFG